MKTLTPSYNQVLQTGLQSLSDIERKAIFLRYWQPCTIAQIAAELNVSWDTADHIINRSVKKLRDHFSDFEMTESPFNELSKP